MKRILALTTGLLFGVSSVFAATNSAAVIPANDWTYEAIDLLAQQGIIDSNDPSFANNKTLTRTQMAYIVAKAIANESKANIAQKALIDKLAIEFALDMNKINSSDKKEQNAMKEKDQSKIKFTGMLQETYKMLKDSDNKTTSFGQEKVRINGEAKIDDNTVVNIRIGSPAARSDMFKDTTTMKYGEYNANSFRADRFFAASKIGLVTVNVGRQALAVDTEDIIVDSDFFSYDGLGVEWNWSGLNFNVKRGRFAKGLDATNSSGKPVYWAFNGYDKYGKKNDKGYFADVDVDSVLISKENGHFNWDAGWARFSNPIQDVTLMSYYTGHMGYNFTNQFSMAIQYGENTKSIADGRYWMVKGVFGDQKLNAKGKQNFTAQYSHFGRYSLYYAYSSLDCPDEGSSDDAFTDLDLAYKYAFSKNMTGKIEYGDVKDKDNNSNNYSFWKCVLTYKF